MENKKLLKFLYKDIAEIEELFVEKGSEGFDEFEIEFIHSRFKGAKEIMQILSEKENKQVDEAKPHPAQDKLKTEKTTIESIEKEDSSVQPQMKENEQEELATDVKESLSSLSEFEKELREGEPSQPQHHSQEVDAVIEEKEDQPESISNKEQESFDPHVQKVAKGNSELTEVEDPGEEEEVDKDVELSDEEDTDEANHRLGDSFSKEKSVNELLAGDSNKLEYKISNSPVESIKTAIGINDRYQYIRELFDGNAEAFSNAVRKLDSMKSINDAVRYIQQNYNWKKNETSLKFVSLIKRRFPNE